MSWRPLDQLDPVTVRVRFGEPLIAREGENPREFAARLQAAVAAL